MYRQLIKAMRNMAVLFGLIGACAPSYSQAAAVNVPLNVREGWRDTKVMVKAGDLVSVETRGILMFWSAMSVNSNGEWLFCPNWKYTMSKGLTYGQSADGARTDSARPFPSAPGGALIFKIGEGKPFFAPGTKGSPGKDYSAELGVNGYSKLPGYSSALEHRFVAQESGKLFVSVNLSEKAKGQSLPGRTTSMWNWPSFNLRIWGKMPTECKVSGKVYDDYGRILAGAEIQSGEAKAISGADGAFVLTLTKDGKYPVTIVKTGFLPTERTVQVSLAYSETYNLGYTYLRSMPGRIAGRVVDEDGGPLEKVEVKIGTITLATDANGVFSLPLRRGFYWVRISKAFANGLVGSVVKNNVEVLPGQEMNLGPVIIEPTIGGASVWMATSHLIQAGQIVALKAGGALKQGTQRFGPDGLAGKTADYYSVMPGSAWGSLVARIGTGRPFIVGKDKSFQAANAGILSFAVNVRATDWKTLSGGFKIEELSILVPGEIEGTVLGAGGKPLTMAPVTVTGVDGIAFTDSSGKFLVKDVPASKNCKVGVSFPGYSPFSKNLPVETGKRSSVGNVTLDAIAVKGSIAIKLLPKSGTTGVVIPVFVEVSNTSPAAGIWGGYLISLKARSVLSGKEYTGIAPTYVVLSPGEKRGTELFIQLPAAAPAGDYSITAELRVPETVSIQDATKQFQAKKDLEGQLSAMKEVKGLVVSQDSKDLNVVAGRAAASVADAAKLLIPTITPKVYSPSKGQVVTGMFALREYAVMIMGKQIPLNDKNGRPLTIWNSYRHYMMGGDSENWVSIGQSSNQSDDFTVYWDTSKVKDGDYIIEATMKTRYDNKPIEGSMTVMVKVRNDARAGSIKGRVTDEDGLPLKDVVVKMLSRNQTISGISPGSYGTKTSVDWEAEDVARSGADGEYVLDGMVSGNYKLQYSLEKYSQASKDVVLTPAQSLAVPAVILTADKCKLNGTARLEDGGSPAGILVSLAGPTALTARIGNDGRFVFNAVKKGAYEVSASKDNYNPEAASFACAPGETKDIQGLILRKKSYSVSGTAKDESGKPLADVAVTLDRSGSRATTGDDGRFSILNIPVGSHVLAFAKAKYEPAEKRFETVTSTGGYNAEANVVMKQTRGILAGSVIPAAAQFFIDGVEVQLQGNKYEAALNPGEHTLKALKKAFETYEEKVTIQPSETLVRDIKLVPAKGDFRLKVEPRDAQVSLDGAPVENYGGEVKVQVLPGKHLLQVHAPARQSFEKEIEIRSGEETALEVTLAVSPGRIQVSVAPADAELSIDGAAVQLTGGKYGAELAPGEHIVKAFKRTFDAYERKAIILAGEPLALDIKLTQPNVSVTVTLEPAAAQLLIDGAVVELKGNKFETALAPGEHSVKALKENFDVFEQKVTVLAGEPLALDIKLVPSKGTMAGAVTPADAQVLIDGAAVKVTGGKYEAALAIGEHTISASRDGYDAVEQKAAVLSGKTTVADIKLAQIPPMVLVSPQGGEALIAGSALEIKWTGGSPAWPIYISIVNGAGTQALKTIVEATPNNGSYSWTVDMPAGSYLIYVQGNRGNSNSGWVYGKPFTVALPKGTLSGTLIPAAAQLFIDGNEIALQGNKYEAALAPGDHTVQALKDRFDTFDGKVTIKSKEVTTLDIKLNEGYGKDGFDKDGYDRAGFNKDGYDRNGYNLAGYDKDGYNKAGYDKDGYNKDGYDKDGYNKSGYDKDGYNKAGYDKDGYNKSGYDKDGYNKSGYDKDGYNKAGYDKDGYDRNGFNKEGFDKAGFNKDGYDRNGFNIEGYNKAGYDKDGYNKSGYDKDGYNKAGYDKDGYNKAGYDKDGYNKLGYDKDGYNKAGYDKDGYNKAGYDKDGYNKLGYDKDGYNKTGYDKDGYNKSGYDKDGYNKSGYDKDGYNKLGYDKDGYSKAGYDKDGYNKSGYDKDGYNKLGYDKDGYNKAGYDKDGYNKSGYDKDGYNKSGYDKDGYNKLGYDKDGYNKAGYDKDGYNKLGYDKDGYNKAGYDKDGYNKLGYDKDGYNKAGYDKDGYNKAGFNKDGYDRNGFNKEGFDKAGFNKDGYDRNGFNREGYNQAGYNIDGYNKAGYDKDGYNKSGYDKDGYNKAGYDKDGYNKAGYDKDGYNKAGYDKDGYNKSGYDKDGYNKAGYDKDGYNKAGYDKDGYNKLGYDKDGYNKAGYDKDGYNKSGYDKDGYNKAGYDKDGYNKLGYDKDGYNKTGYDKDGYNKSGYDKDGYNKSGFNKDGYDRNGFNKEGFDRAGFNKDGYDRNGFNKEGYNQAGYNKDGYNKAGYDKDGYNKSGYDKDGYNKLGYDKDGYNKSGYDKDGYNKAGLNKGGYRKGEGKLNATVEPASSEVLIDGAVVELHGNKYEAALAAGEHAVKVSKDKFDTYNGKVTVKLNETAVLDVKLNQSKSDPKTPPVAVPLPPAPGLDVVKPQPKPKLAFTANLNQVFMGETVTLTVQTPDGATDVELAADKGQFEGTGKSVITGRTDAKGKFEAKWSSQTPAKHKIKLMAGKGGAVGQKETEVEVKLLTPEVNAIIKNVKGNLTMGANLTIDAQVKNNGKVTGKYRIELELRGTSGFPLFILKPVELELSAGESKPVKFDWRVTALGEYTAKMVIYLVGDMGELQRVNTYQAKLSYSKLPK